MDSMTEKTCLDEISTLIFDANEKVTVKSISNNWDITNSNASDILVKWLDQNQKKGKDFVFEFQVWGVNSKGIPRRSVVNEDMKKALEEKWKKLESKIYSVDIKSNSRTLELSVYEPIKVKRILLSSGGSRDLKIPIIPVIKTEPTTSKKADEKPRTPFGMMKPTAVKKEAVKVKVEEEVKEVVKVESPEKSPKEPSVEVKKEKKSPEDSKPASKAPAPKRGVKNQKVVQGKAAISSFFTAKSVASVSTTETPKEKPKDVPQDVKKENIIDIDDGEDEKVQVKSCKRSRTPEKPKSKQQDKKKPAASVFTTKTLTEKLKDEPKEVKKESIIDLDDGEDEDEVKVKSSKRSRTPEKPKSKQQEKKKPAAKKLKIKPVQGNKRSRIRVMEDSSDDDDEEEAEKSELEEPESKFIKFDRELTPEPEEHQVNNIPEQVTPSKPVANNKHKGKRWVTKRFQTDDGFIRTERVQEEYSASEDENDENRKKNSPPKVVEKLEKKSVEKKNSTEKKSAEKKPPASKAAKSVAKGQQGNIRSFFPKK